MAGLLGLLGLWPVRPVPAAAAAVVFVAPVDGTIDLGLAPFVRRILDEAAAAGAAAVIFEVNTFGGRVDAAVLIRDAWTSSPTETRASPSRSSAWTATGSSCSVSQKGLSTHVHKYTNVY